MDLYDLTTAKWINRIFYGLLFVAGVLLNIFGAQNQELSYLSVALMVTALLVGYPMLPLVEEDGGNGFHIFICHVARFLGMGLVLLYLLIMFGATSSGHGTPYYTFLGAINDLNSDFNSTRPAIIFLICVITSMCLRSLVINSDTFADIAYGHEDTTLDSDYGFILFMAITIPVYSLLSRVIPLSILIATVTMYTIVIAAQQRIIYTDSIFRKIWGYIILILAAIYTIIVITNLGIDSNTMSQPWKYHSFGKMLEYAVYMWPLLMAVATLFFRILGRIAETFDFASGYIFVLALPVIILALQLAILYLWGVVLGIIGAVIVISIIVGVIL